MITKLNKNVLLLEDIPSNLIQEAILILKTEDKKIKNKTKEILMIEAKEIINDCSNKLQNEYEKKCKEEREVIYKRRRKKVNLLASIGFVLFTCVIIMLANIIK